MTHLSSDELVRWRDAGAEEDRERVLTHLASCDACRREYAGHVRRGSDVGPPSSFAPDRFVARGIAVYAGRSRTWWRRPEVWLAVPVAAAAVLALALVVPRSPVAPLTEPTTAVRGGEIVAVAPAGEVGRVTEFAWSSPFTATRYRVIVRDAGGIEVFSGEADRERLAIEAAVAARLVPGRYSWIVEAIDRDGLIISASPAQPFQVGR